VITTKLPANQPRDKRVDLHTHTTASDGLNTPGDLVRLALGRNLAALGVTDHDSLGGVQEALHAAQGTDLVVFPGIELNTDVPGREVHIIGYFAEPETPYLQQMLALLQNSREDRAQQILAKLASLGIHLEWDKVVAEADGSIGRPHIAQALLDAGYVETIGEAFEKYIGKDGPAYVEHLRLTPEQAVELVVQGGGVPVLAHPTDVLDYIEPLIAVGLQGLEVYYPTHTQVDVDNLRRLADQYGLITTGGTDHHGRPRYGDTQLGDIYIPLDVIPPLQSACNAALARYRKQHAQAPSEE